MYSYKKLFCFKCQKVIKLSYHFYLLDHFVVSNIKWAMSPSQFLYIFYKENFLDKPNIFILENKFQDGIRWFMHENLVLETVPKLTWKIKIRAYFTMERKHQNYFTLDQTLVMKIINSLWSLFEITLYYTKSSIHVPIYCNFKFECSELKIIFVWIGQSII